MTETKVTNVQINQNKNMNNIKVILSVLYQINLAKYGNPKKSAMLNI